MNDFATRFKEARARAGASVAEIAKKLGVSVQSVYGWESGAVPKGDRLERLAEFLDVDLHWLAFGQGAASALRDEDGDLAVPLLDTITKAGQAFLAQLPIRPVDVFVEGSVVGKFQQAVLVLGGADKVVNGMEQRDIGIKVGGEGCTTIVIRDGNLMIPPDWNLDEKDPEVAYKIRKETGITQSDALIIGGGDTHVSAVEAAVSAALNMF